ncbi:ArsR family transcriptional regulator [Patescibacteria group bacterium]|nr:MAG: ArsR family transcriptional regulator [Patescibacteria group bacterium]
MDVNKWERLYKALANKRRLGIISSLSRHRELSVAEISEQLHLSFKATSKHLNILKTEDLVQNEQRSRQVFYWLGPDQPPAVRCYLDDNLAHIRANEGKAKKG